jgi:head-tail adaptor
VNYTYITAQADVRCRLDDAGGREYLTSSGKYVKADYTLFVNYRDVQVALSEKDFRVVVDSKYYNILFISDAGGAGHHYEIALERVF